MHLKVTVCKVWTRLIWPRIGNMSLLLQVAWITATP